MNIIKTLKILYYDRRITKQEYKTYRGQALSGDIEGCIRGMQRKKLIGADYGKTNELKRTS